MIARRSVLAAGAAVACGAQRGPTPQVRSRPRLKGVNIAGLEFNRGRLPGRLDHDYVAPKDEELAYYRAAGATVFRVPFLWERLQPELGGAFDQDYLALLERAVSQAAGSSLILDAHQYGRRRMGGELQIIGESAAVTSAHFSQFWGSLARHFHDSPNVIFGLQNEPFRQDMDILVRVQNEAIASIRAAGARQMVLVCGNAWSGAHSWRRSGNAQAMLAIHDPADNLAFDVHQYLDGDSSGRSGACAPQSGQRLAPFTQWARQHRKRGFLGEFGAGPGGDCPGELDALLQTMEENGDVWLGWTYWAGGDWWPDDYPLSIRPASFTPLRDRPQMAVLRRYFRT